MVLPASASHRGGGLVVQPACAAGARIGRRATPPFASATVVGGLRASVAHLGAVGWRGATGLAAGAVWPQPCQRDRWRTGSRGGRHVSDGFPAWVRVCDAAERAENSAWRQHDWTERRARVVGAW